MKVKSAAIFAGLVTGLCSTAAPAIASSTYVGASYEGMNLTGVTKGSNLSNSLNEGGGIHIGERFGRVSFEASYSKGDASKTVIGTPTYATKVSMSTLALDVLVYMPVRRSEFSLFGTIGAGDTSGHAISGNPAAPLNISKSTIAYRAGGGLQWKPIEEFSFDLTGRYQGANLTFAKGAIVYSLGMNVYF